MSANRALGEPVLVERARYFFSIRHRDRLLPDREGVDLPVGTDLESCARFLAQRLRTDESMAGALPEGCTVEITDGGGCLLLTVFVPTE